MAFRVHRNTQRELYSLLGILAKHTLSYIPQRVPNRQERILSSILAFERNKKNFLNHFETAIFLLADDVVDYTNSRVERKVVLQVHANKS